MKQTLGAVCAILFMLATVACNQSTNSSSASSANDSVCGGLKIAYINTDSLLMRYTFSQKMSDDLMSKEESSRAEYNQKARVFQQDVMEFQRKVQNNGFISVERAQKEQERLAKVEQDLQALNEKLSTELMQVQASVNKELRDTITNFLNEYAAGKYLMVLSNTMGDNVLYAADGIDITNEVVEELNKRYEAKK